MRKITTTGFVFTVLFASVAAPSGAIAEDEIFRVKSMAESRVQIEFFSEDRHHQWPGNGRAYDLNDFKVHEFNLACVNDEKICYGAWVTGNANTYWGMGAHGTASCSDCCVACRGGHTREIILRDPIHR